MNRNFKATIITPFHNTELDIFKTTYESVLKQTIGFENIEWIIVLHNCSKEYLDGVHALLDKYDNVLLKELNNSARSASSPRNYGLQFVTSPYIEFLDSDDTISPNTVETCVKEMETEHPDIVIFRMAYVKQNESVVSVITDITLWNPLESKIILTGEETTSRPELYSTINFCTHNRFFDANFIKEHGFHFDEDITMAEDAFFTLSCYTAARKIVVLPQFIGHSYFVNSKSAVQSPNKKPEDVLHFSYGFEKIFNLLLEHHAYYNHFFITVLQAYIGFALSSPGFSKENWKQLQDDMRPYAQMLTVPPVNKFFNKEQGQSLYDFVTHYILDPIGDVNKDSYNYRNGEPVAIEALIRNADTDFAGYYHFADIFSLDDYFEKVPLQTYNDYAKIVELAETVGESKLIASDHIEAYAGAYDLENRSSSSPMTAELCTEMGQNFISICKGETTFLVIGTLSKRNMANDGAYEDSLYSIIIRNGIGNLKLADISSMPRFAFPMELLFSTENKAAYYMNLLEALRCRELTQIYASNTLLLLNCLNILTSFGEDICKDIAQGTANRNGYYRVEGELTVGLREPDEKRAKEISEALKKDRKDILRAIWPKLKRVIAHSGGTFEMYTRKLPEWFEKLPLISGDLFTPFGIVGKDTGKNNEYDLAREEIFYEFIPLAEKNNGHTLLASDLKVNEDYELVITNRHGIYRLQSGIIIRPTQIHEGNIRFKETRHPLTISGETFLSAETIEDALFKTTDNALDNYYYTYDEKNSCLKVIVLLKDKADEKELAEKFDESLLELALPEEKKNVALLNPCKLYTYKSVLVGRIWEKLKNEYQLSFDSFVPVPGLSEESFEGLHKDLKEAEEKEGN